MNSLRSFLIGLGLVTGSAIACAQRYYSPDFAIGVRAGATVSEMSWSPTVRQSFTPGYTVGITARYTEEKYFGLIAELNLTQRGWAENFNATASTAASPLSYRRRFTYIQLPIMTHIYFGSNKFRGFVNLGPEIGYMIGDHISSNFDYKNLDSVEDFPANRRSEQLAMKVTRKFDYGIAGGIGAEVRVANKHSFLIEGRFYYGLANVFPSSRGDTFGASRTMSIEVTAAYMFRLK